MSIPHIRREEAVTVRKVPGCTATMLIWWRKVNEKSFIFPRCPPGEFSFLDLLDPFFVRPSLKDTEKRIAKKRITASPDSFIMESIQGASSKRDAAPEDESIAMEVIATISKTLSTVNEERLVVRERSLLFFRIYILLRSPIRAGRITFADWLIKILPVRNPSPY